MKRVTRSTVELWPRLLEPPGFEPGASSALGCSSIGIRHKIHSGRAVLPRRLNLSDGAAEHRCPTKFENGDKDLRNVQPVARRSARLFPPPTRVGQDSHLHVPCGTRISM